MKDDINIFIVNEDGLLEINKKEARTIKEFKTIIERDKGSKGDADGRKKLFAFKELLYIYLYCHPSSLFRDLPDKTRAIKCRNHAKLPKEWKVDNVILAGIERFNKSLELSALYKSYINASRSVYGVGQDLEYFNNRREQLRINIKSNTERLDAAIEDTEIGELNKLIDKDTNTLLSVGEKVLSISNNLPTSFKTVEDLRKKVAAENSAQKEIYGGGSLGNREK